MRSIHGRIHCLKGYNTTYSPCAPTMLLIKVKPFAICTRFISCLLCSFIVVICLCLDLKTTSLKKTLGHIRIILIHGSIGSSYLGPSLSEKPLRSVKCSKRCVHLVFSSSED